MRERIKRMSGRLIITILMFVAMAMPLLSVGKDGEVTGKIKDSETGSPLPGAVIALTVSSDSKPESGAISGKDGSFTVKKLSPGRYTLTISYVGYKEKKITPIIINAEMTAVNVGEIGMLSANVTTSEVEVVGHKDMLEIGLDKKIINIDKSIGSIGGTAVDVLRNAPSVSVSIDGVVSLRGSQNVHILVDGKPSGLSGSDILDLIPATAIDYIEVITNPSAKYDPESTAGIINIVLKKEGNYGMNGMLSGTVGTGDKYSGSASLNYRTGAFNLYGNYDVRYFSMTGIEKSTQGTTYKDNTTYLIKGEDFRRHGGFNNVKLGADYFIDNFNTIGFSVLLGFGQRNSNEFLKTNTNNGLNMPVDYFTRDIRERFPNHNADFNLSYKRNFGQKGHELTANLYYSNASRNIGADYIQGNYKIDSTTKLFMPDGNPPGLQNIGTDNKTGNYYLQVDYVLPFGKETKFEAGYKGYIRNLEQNYKFMNYDYSTNLWIINTYSSNKFAYDEQVHALYALYTGETGSFTYQGGLRAELSDITSNQKTIYSINKSKYLSFYPSGLIKYSFSTLNSIQLSYSRRINRPSFRQLNSFIDYEDPNNLEGGNPKLKPEYVNSLELGHSISFGKTSINSSLFFKETNDMISEVRTVIDTGVTMTTDVNIAKGRDYGAELIISQELLHWWRLDCNASAFRAEIRGLDGNNNLNISGNSWTGKINSNMTLFGFMNFQLSGNYESPHIEAQTTEKADYWADLGIKAELMNGNGIISFRISDLFNTMRHSSYSTGTDFYIDSYRKRASRVAYLGFTYKFNNYKHREKPKGENGGSEDYQE